MTQSYDASSKTHSTQISHIPCSHVSYTRISILKVRANSIRFKANRLQRSVLDFLSVILPLKPLLVVPQDISLRA